MITCAGSTYPAPVGRFIETAYPDGVPGVDTAAMEGYGRFRQRPLPWLPFTNTIWLRPGWTASRICSSAWGRSG
jgi:hypothetical protein